MNTQIAITLEEILSLLPKQVYLYYIDYRDNLDEQLPLLQECFEAKNFDKLYEFIYDCYLNAENFEVSNLIEELKNDIESKFDIEDAQYLLDEYEDEIRDEIYNRDKSNLVQDLLNNTSSIPLRVTMYSNYDCINSHYFETSGGGYSYKESYFGAMVDALKLNPAKVKKMLIANDVKCFGSFPNLKQREGKEYVSYEHFWQELQNSCCGANLLTFVCTLNASDILTLEDSVNKIKIPKGNNCGLFSSMQGGGSIIGMELQRDLILDLSKHGKTKYDSYGIEIDCRGGSGYSIDEAYGVTSSFWGKEIEFIKK